MKRQVLLDRHLNKNQSKKLLTIFLASYSLRHESIDRTCRQIIKTTNHLYSKLKIELSSIEKRVSFNKVQSFTSLVASQHKKTTPLHYDHSD